MSRFHCYLIVILFTNPILRCLLSIEQQKMRTVINRLFDVMIDSVYNKNVFHWSDYKMVLQILVQCSSCKVVPFFQG